MYDCSSTPVLAHGIEFGDRELSQALATRVSEVVYDAAGLDELEDLLSGLSATKFETQTVQRVLSAPRGAIEDWRIGEAFAEAYLNDYRGCQFPWPSSRDLKNPEASPAGADLIGFVAVGGVDWFAFGEVKTSYESNYPPRVMHGRDGMNHQIEALRDRHEKVDALILYIAFRARGTAWWPRFQSAFRSFSNGKNYVIFGVLVRDVDPNERDLKARCKALAKECPASVSIELRAFYLPRGVIVDLPNRIPAKPRRAP
ncbi:MAG: hypothetical protein U0790_28255 [Isosphaeraceae bacterium]